jgi:8-oxo-dGTP pyrophosphatase MutT (NUDIX family)
MKISTIVFPVRDNLIYLANKKRGFGIGYLNGYGGKQQPEDLTISHTAAREMEEEGGVVVLPENLDEVAVINFFEEEIPVFECHVFFCHEWKGQFQETEEMSAPKAYDIANPPYDQMWDADRVWLPIVCSGKKIRAVSIYKKGMNKQVSFDYQSLS